MAAERAINMALRVVGIGNVERDFKRVGDAGSKSFEQIERSANGADRAVSEYTSRLRRAVQNARNVFDSLPEAQLARRQNPSFWLSERNAFILHQVEEEKNRIRQGLPELRNEVSSLDETFGRTLTTYASAAAIGAAAAKALLLVKDAIVASAQAFMEHEQALSSFEASLALAGNRSDATASEIAALGAQIRNSSLQTEEGALRAAQALATVPGITKAALTEALASSAALADALGTELPDLVERRTLPVLQALADRDMKALIEATKGLSDGLANTIVKLAAAGDTAGAQQALFRGLRDAAGNGPDGLTTATDQLNDAWDRLKLGLGEDIAGPATVMLSAIARALDWVRDRAEAANGSTSAFFSNFLGTIPMIGPALRYLPGAGSVSRPASGDDSPSMLARVMGSLESARDRAERLQLEKRYAGGGKKAGGGGRKAGKSDAEREAERLQKEAERTRAAADKIIVANQETIDSFRERAAEARAKIGLEGAALEAYERQAEVEAAVRKINTELIDAEVEARRAAAAAAGEQFDAVQATAEATDIVEGQRDVVRGLAEDYADASRELAEFRKQQQQAAAIIEATRTPMEQVNAEIEKAIELLRAGRLSADDFDRRMAQLAETMADVRYETNEAAQAWRGFGNDVGRTLSDFVLNGGSALEVLQELIRLPLERLLYQNVETPIANWIDGLTGNNREKNIADARAGLPSADQILGAKVQMLGPAADAASTALASVQVQGMAAANSLAMVAQTGNPIVDLTGETERATAAMAGVEPVVGQLGNTMANAIASMTGGTSSGGGWLASLLRMGVSAVAGGAGLASEAARLSSSAAANIAANPALFASGTPSVPVGRWFGVGENGRELMRYHGGGRLEVMGSTASRRFQSDAAGDTYIIHQTNVIPAAADRRLTQAAIDRGNQVSMARVARKSLAAPAGRF